MILAWDAVPAGPIGPRPKWPTTSLSRKSVRVADSVTEGNCENVQQHEQKAVPFWIELYEIWIDLWHINARKIASLCMC